MWLEFHRCATPTFRNEEAHEQNGSSISIVFDQCILCARPNNGAIKYLRLIGADAATGHQVQG